MTKMLICPKCGEYQEDTTNTRKMGVAAKKAGMWVGQFAMKSVTKLAASSIGFDDHYSQYAAGSFGKEAANFLGINPDKVSIDDVKYKCSSCKHYWVGQDNPDYFNEVQNKTVGEHHQQDVNLYHSNFVLSIIGTAITVLGLYLSYWIWIHRVFKEYVNMFGFPATSYSWHYYVFWPLVIICGYLCLWGVIGIFDNYSTYKKMKKMSNVEYARTKMNLGNDSQ